MVMLASIFKCYCHNLPPKASQHWRSEMGQNSSATVQLVCRSKPGFFYLSGTQDCVVRTNSFTTGIKEVSVLTIKMFLSNQLLSKHLYPKLASHFPEEKQRQVLGRK